MKYSFRCAAGMLLLTVLLTAGCKKKAFDDFYARPASLQPPIYQQLQARGNFTNFLSLIDKAGYKQTLGSAGYWTIFAPTDSAFSTDTEFAAFLQSKGFSNVASVDSATAQSIVQFLLVFNAFEKDRLDDYQSTLGWVPNSAFKRRTAYYTGFYDDTSYTGQAYKAFQSNRNNNGNTNSYFVAADNNNKYIPYFTSDYFSAKGLTAYDYNYFYPTSTYTGFNVANAVVTEKDIPAENGVIHIINRVVTPLKSIDQYLRTKPEYSEFRKLLERFMVLFVKNVDATRRYQVLTGKPDDVYIKVYSNLLAYSPNNENFFKLQDNDGQKDGWTMFVPKNDSLLKYMNTVVLENYPSVNALPLNIVADLINSHMWQTTVWPSKFASTYNFLGEPSHIDASANIVDKKILSNGILYGTNKVNEPNVFSTIYGKAYLNPKFSIMTRLLDMDLRNVITNPNSKYTMFMMPDAVLIAKGFNYNVGANAWTFTNPSTGVVSSNDSNRINLLRILNSCVVETPNNELANIGQVGFAGITATYGGEYIKYNGNKIISAGTVDRGINVTIDSIKQAKNGQVVYLNDLLYFSYAPVGKHIEILGTPTTSEYNIFWNYLKRSTTYDSTTSTIIGTSPGSFYTVFVPNNAMMKQAITDGLLPGTPAVPNYFPTLAADKVKVEKFIQYHILDKRSVIANGVDVGGFPSLLKNAAGDPVTFSIQYPGGVFELTDQFGRKAKMITALSNNLSNRAMIHLIDNYMKPN